MTTKYMSIPPNIQNPTSTLPSSIVVSLDVIATVVTSTLNFKWKNWKITQDRVFELETPAGNSNLESRTVENEAKEKWEYLPFHF